MGQDLPCLGCVSIKTVGVSQHRQEQGIQSRTFLKYFDCFVGPSHLFIGQAKEVVSGQETWIQFESLFKLLYSQLVLARVVEDSSSGHTDHRRKRVKFLGVLDLFDGFFSLPISAK